MKVPDPDTAVRLEQSETKSDRLQSEISDLNKKLDSLQRDVSDLKNKNNELEVQVSTYNQCASESVS